jgi:hypothetical protein
MITGQRINPALLVAAGLAIASSYFWWSYVWLSLIGLLTAGVGVSALVRTFRRPPALRQQRRLIRDLWSLLQQAPTDIPLIDPVTSNELFVEREQDNLALAIARPQDRIDGTVTRYVVGLGGAPLPPPLFRHTTVRQGQPGSFSAQSADGMLHLNVMSGARETTSDELAEVGAQLRRAITASSRP